jgi:hypothetical protein
MKARKENISLENTFIGNIKRVVYSEKLMEHVKEWPDIQIYPEYETTGDIARYSANIRLYLKKQYITMVFSLPVLTSDPTPTLFPCLTNELPKPMTKYDGPDVPQVLNNTLEMIFFGWMIILNKISNLNLPLWTHSTSFYKSVAKNGNDCYTLNWTAVWFGSFISKYERKFQIISYLDSENNAVIFNKKTDVDADYVTYNINEIDKLIMHIDNHLEFRFWFKARYEEQIQRIELLLHAANAKC